MWSRRAAERRGGAQKVVPDRDRTFLPGDMVLIALNPVGGLGEFNGRRGVVTYGPDKDNNPGWLVSTAAGSIRCVGKELTMYARREDR